MLDGIELPVLFAVFFVFKFPFFLSSFLCKPGVGSSSPLPECFQKILCVPERWKGTERRGFARENDLQALELDPHALVAPASSN
jgi:hypothetical protein